MSAWRAGLAQKRNSRRAGSSRSNPLSNPDLKRSGHGLPVENCETNAHKIQPGVQMGKISIATLLVMCGAVILAIELEPTAHSNLQSATGSPKSSSNTASTINRSDHAPVHLPSIQKPIEQQLTEIATQNESSGIETAREYLAVLSKSGPTRDQFTQDVSRCIDSNLQFVNSADNIKLISLSCYRAGCLASFDASDAASYENLRKSLMSHPDLQWAGPAILSPPTRGERGIEGTVIFLNTEESS